ALADFYLTPSTCGFSFAPEAKPSVSQGPSAASRKPWRPCRRSRSCALAAACVAPNRIAPWRWLSHTLRSRTWASPCDARRTTKGSRPRDCYHGRAASSCGTAWAKPALSLREEEEKSTVKIEDLDPRGARCHRPLQTIPRVVSASWCMTL